MTIGLNRDGCGPPHVTVWWADLRMADAALEQSLPAAERARLDDLVAPADRGRRLVGAAVLQDAVRAHHGWAPAREVAVDRTCLVCGCAHGRPVVGGGPHVSVAHAGVLIVVATCAESPVGVDVEQVSRFGDSGPAAVAWVGREARDKAGPVAGGGSTTLTLTPPLAGYVAAVAVAAGSGRPFVSAFTSRRRGPLHFGNPPRPSP